MQELISKSRHMLLSRREEQRRYQEQCEMKQLAESLHSLLTDLETELKTSVGWVAG